MTSAKNNTTDSSAGGNFAYMVRCSDGSLYSGWTNDIKKRLEAHNSGQGAKYTRSRLPVTLAYLEEFPTKEEAMSREWHLKRLSKKQKEALVSEVFSVIF